MGEARHTLIIAEAGVNHNGDINLAKKLIDVAADAGVDLVKFQTFKAKNIVSPKALKAKYQQENIDDSDESQFQMLKNLELSEEDHGTLIAYADQKGIGFFSTAFDVEGLEYLNSLGFEQFKVPSGEITNYPYLRRMGSFKKPVILSTGMSTIEDIKSAIAVLEKGGVGRNQITVLHCNTQYPTPMSDVNLLAMNHIGSELGVDVGYSDHTLGIEVPIAAVALGARVIEKHFTLDRSLPGPDHRASLEPNELKAMVTSIRNVEQAISGSEKKEVSQSEAGNILAARKSIHSARRIHSGEILTEDDLIPLRPASGVSPMDWESVIGKKVKNTLEAFEPIHANNLTD